MDTSIAPEILAGIKEALACVALGAILGTAIYGITVLQTYIYFRRYTNDTLRLKILVGVLFILDTTTSALVAYGIYRYMVIYFEAPASEFLVILPTLAVENVVTVLIAPLNQCFFAQRLWYVSKNRKISGLIVLLSMGALVPGIVLAVQLFTNTQIFSVVSVEIRILAGFANGLSVLCDVVIAGGLCYYLNSSRTGFSRTNNMVDRLMVYAIQRGLITAICQACHMITTVAFPKRFLFLPFAFMQGKLYCNTVLATLNVRNSLNNSRSKGDAIEPGSLILTSIPGGIEGRRHNSRLSHTIEINVSSTATSSKDQTTTLVTDSLSYNDNKVTV